MVNMKVDIAECQTEVCWLCLKAISEFLKDFPNNRKDTFSLVVLMLISSCKVSQGFY